MHGPLFKLRLRLAVRSELAGRGLSRRQIRDRLDELDDDLVETAIVQTGAKDAVFALEHGVTAIGDGSILKAILEFLQSDLGQAIIKFIIGLLL